MNKVELIGRITKDLELRFTQTNNKAVTSFTIAINKKINGQDSTDFINCVAWGPTAEFICKYFKKGQAIAVVGRLQNRSYDDNGQKRYVTEVVVEETFFAGSKPEEKNDIENNNYNESDLPF